MSDQLTKPALAIKSSTTYVTGLDMLYDFSWDVCEVGGALSICRSVILAASLPTVATRTSPGWVRISIIGLLGQSCNCIVNVYEVLGARAAGVTVTFNATFEPWFLSTSTFSRLVTVFLDGSVMCKLWLSRLYMCSVEKWAGGA